MYRHVDILNEHGYRATIVHTKPGFRCAWFENDTEVTDVRNIRVGRADLLVVGELDVDLVAVQKRPVRHVVLNQSGFLTWKNQPELVSRHYLSDSGPEAIVTVSRYSKKLLSRAFPRIPVHKVRPSVDTETFRPSGYPLKRITYMPRRGAEDMQLALRVLAGSELLADWEIKPLLHLRHEEVSAELQRSMLFVSLGQQEGFGLPAAEAMACGNYVVGYHGFGGSEYFHLDYCSPISPGDVVALSASIEAAVRQETSEPGWLRTRGLRAADRIRTVYSPAMEASDVIMAYAPFAF